MKVLITDNLAKEGIEILKRHPNFEVDVKLKMPEEEIISCIADYDVLLVRSETKVNAKIIEAGKNLKIIGRAGVGVDNIDVKAASRKGIIVMNAPEGNTISAAEHTIALLFCLARNIVNANNSLKNRQWERKKFIGKEIYGKTIGIIGLGKIGTEVAHRLQSFGAKIIAYDPFISKEYAQEQGISLVSKEELFKNADFITIHTPITNETRNLINKESISLMKEGVEIINCARGGIVNESDIREGIVSGKIKGAAFDVFAEEPPFSSPILDLDNVIVTPHLGASTEEAQIKVAVTIANQVIEYFEKGLIINAVNVPVVKLELKEKLQPYLILAEKLGLLLGQIIEGRINSIEIQYSSSISQYDIRPLTVAIEKGILQSILEREVNYVNAPVITEERNIKVIEGKVSGVEDFTNSIFVKAGNGVKVSVKGIVTAENQLQIVKINDFSVQIPPHGYLLVCLNQDKPGVIGKVGTILGNAGINIAGMQVGRKEIGKEALTVINIDSPIETLLLKEIEKITEITKIKLVDLG